MAKLSVADAAEILNQKSEEWVRSTNVNTSIDVVVRRATKGLSKNPIFNLAAFFKYNFPSMTGMDDQDWIETARECKKILGGKQ